MNVKLAHTVGTVGLAKLNVNWTMRIRGGYMNMSNSIEYEDELNNRNN